MIGVLIGVSFAVTAFRFFAPSEVFPVTYRRGRTAHLDVGGPRGEAIRKAVEDQLGLTVSEIKPVGLSGSAGSTPLRLRVEGASSPYLFGKLYSRTHLRSDRWYKLGRELLYGRLEDEKPFNTVRRLVQQEDYALRVVREAGAPGAKSYGFVELTPEREYMLVTEFLEDAVELGVAVVDEALIDEALHLIRILWDAGLAHRDIKPANLMVRDGRILLIDVAFAELRPTPWRQAVDLANMMLCLALRSSAQQVYDRALRQFTIDEVSEAFAAARGLALPSQLRRALRAEGRDLHGEFLGLLPERPRPIKVQRWTMRRVVVALVAAILIVLLVLNCARLFRHRRQHPHPGATSRPLCDEMEPMWLQAQAVPTAAARAVRGLVARGLVVRAADRQQRAIDDHRQSRPRRLQGDRPALRRDRVTSPARPRSPPTSPAPAASSAARSAAPTPSSRGTRCSRAGARPCDSARATPRREVRSGRDRAGRSGDRLRPPRRPGAGARRPLGRTPAARPAVLYGFVRQDDCESRVGVRRR